MQCVWQPALIERTRVKWLLTSLSTLPPTCMEVNLCDRSLSFLCARINQRGTISWCKSPFFYFMICSFFFYLFECPLPCVHQSFSTAGLTTMFEHMQSVQWWQILWCAHHFSSCDVWFGWVALSDMNIVNHCNKWKLYKKPVSWAIESETAYKNTQGQGADPATHQYCELLFHITCVAKRCPKYSQGEMLWVVLSAKR